MYVNGYLSYPSRQFVEPLLKNMHTLSQTQEAYHTLGNTLQLNNHSDRRSLRLV